MSSTNVATPIGDQDRISALDVARGFALLGILIMNSTGMALYDSAYYNFTADGGDGPLNFAAWSAMMVYFEGAMRGLFSLLFGAGIIIFLDRLEAKNEAGAVDLHGRRMLWLIAFGLFNTFILLYPYDILIWYGIAGMFLFPLRKLSAKNLMIIFAAAFVVSNIFDIQQIASDANARSDYEQAQIAVTNGDQLSDEQQEAVDDWQERVDGWTGTVEKKTEAAEWHRNRNFIEFSSKSWSEYADYFSSVGFWSFLFDIVFVVILGMALARNGVLLGQASNATYIRLLVIGYGIGIALGIWRTVNFVNLDFAIDALTLDRIVYQTRRIALSLGHVGLIFCAARFGVFKGLQNLLGAIGRMAFTNYLTQSLLQVLAWYGPGLALHGQLERYQIWYVILAIWVAQAVFSLLWLRHYRFGPLEWLWRALTYGTLPAIRIAAQPERKSKPAE